MADPLPDRRSNHDTEGETDSGSDRDSTTGIPRWVKVFAIIAFIVVLLFVILMVARGPGGGHGPSRHMSYGNGSGRAQSVTIMAGDPSLGGHRS